MPVVENFSTNGSVYQWNPGNPAQGIPGFWFELTTAMSTYRYRDRPTSVKRSKPADLFASATTRDFTVETVSSSTASYSGNVIQRGPATFFMSRAHALDLTSDLDPSKADGKVRAKIKDMNVNLAQSFAEYRQVSGMFVKAGTDIVMTLRKLRQGRALPEFVRILQGKKGDPVSKRIANRWLEYQYGLKPLMQDMYGLSDQLTKDLTLGTYKFASSSWRDSRNATVIGFYDGSAKSKWTLQTIGTVETKTKARWLVKASGMKQLSEVGITNPALLAWELIPYSFCVDWFINVGDFLGSLDALVGVSGLAVNRGYKYTLMSETSGIGFITHKTIRKRRVATGGGLSLPGLKLSPPKSLYPLWNTLALLRQSRGR
jgi:hypothetical protein